MSHSSSQTFLRELDKKLWTAADKLPVGTEIKESGRLAHPYQITSTGKLIATIPFQHADLQAKDILGHVLQKGAQASRLFLPTQTAKMAVPPSFTPKSIVSLIVEMIEPYQGRVYDPAMGSGRFFVKSERFIKEHGGTIGDIMVFGQDQWAWGAHLRRAKRARRVRLRRKQPNQSNPTTWRLAAMNMAIRGIDFDFGKEPADTFTRDRHPDLRADFVMANPPFNIKEWWDGKLEGDARWKYGTPPQGNANFAWVQHMLHHLAPNGSMALLLANGSMSSDSRGEGDIRRALIEADLVECMVALPGNLFTNTTIPACIWFLTKNKANRSRPGAAALRDRRGKTLFIDARKLGFMKDRVLRDFSVADIKKIAGIFCGWRTGGYEDVAGLCKSATLKEIEINGYVLTSGRYVGAEDVENDGESFDDRITRMVEELDTQFADSLRLEQSIKANLEGLGYGR